ncbi:MAG: TlpA disulfide reductase family protein [Vicinamibacterales bacterium]
MLPGQIPPSWCLRATAVALTLAAAACGGASTAGEATAPATSHAAAAPTDGAPGVTSVRFFKDPRAVPAFTLKTLDGAVIDSASLAGKVTIVNFWATWCPPCREEIPQFVALQEKYKDHLQIIGISMDEGSIDAVRAFASQHGINYPIVMATPEFETMFEGVYALPTSFVLDSELRIVQKHIGLYDAATFEAETRALAGLETAATIEYVDGGKPVGLANAAQALEIPGVDLASLTPEQRSRALEQLNTDPCTCGCGLTVARCRVDDPACGVSLPAAQKIVAAIAAGGS